MCCLYTELFKRYSHPLSRSDYKIIQKYDKVFSSKEEIFIYFNKIIDFLSFNFKINRDRIIKCFSLYFDLYLKDRSSYSLRQLIHEVLHYLIDNYSIYRFLGGGGYSAEEYIKEIVVVYIQYGVSGVYESSVRDFLLYVIGRIPGRVIWLGRLEVEFSKVISEIKTPFYRLVVQLIRELFFRGLKSLSKFSKFYFKKSIISYVLVKVVARGLGILVVRFQGFIDRFYRSLREFFRFHYYV